MSKDGDPESEVRKLQELVKKLEKQNVKLRQQHPEPDLMSESMTSNFSEISNASTISAPLSNVRTLSNSSGKRSFKVPDVGPGEPPATNKISAQTAAGIVSESIRNPRSRSGLVMSCTEEPYDGDSHHSTKSSVSSVGEANTQGTTSPPSKPPPAPPRPVKQRSKSSVGLKTDDCWLKKVEGDPRKDSIVPWMRQVFDQPTKDIVQAKTRLQRRLEEFRLTGRLFAAGSQPSLLNFELSNKLSHHKTLPDVRVSFEPTEKPQATKVPSPGLPPDNKPYDDDSEDSSCESSDSLEAQPKSKVASESTRKTSVLDIARQQEADLKAAVSNYLGRKNGSTGSDLNVISPHGSKQNLNQPLDSSKRSVSGYQLNQRRDSLSMAGNALGEMKRSTSGQDLYRPMADVQPIENNPFIPETNQRVNSGKPQRTNHPSSIDHSRRTQSGNQRSNRAVAQQALHTQPQIDEQYRLSRKDRQGDKSNTQNSMNVHKTIQSQQPGRSSRQNDDQSQRSTRLSRKSDDQIQKPIKLNHQFDDQSQRPPRSTRQYDDQFQKPTRSSQQFDDQATNDQSQRPTRSIRQFDDQSKKPTRLNQQFEDQSQRPTLSTPQYDDQFQKIVRSSQQYGGQANIDQSQRPTRSQFDDESKKPTRLNQQFDDQLQRPTRSNRQYDDQSQRPTRSTRPYDDQLNNDQSQRSTRSTRQFDDQLNNDQSQPSTRSTRQFDDQLNNDQSQLSTRSTRPYDDQLSNDQSQRSTRSTRQFDDQVHHPSRSSRPYDDQFQISPRSNRQHDDQPHLSNNLNHNIPGQSYRTNTNYQVTDRPDLHRSSASPNQNRTQRSENISQFEPPREHDVPQSIDRSRRVNSGDLTQHNFRDPENSSRNPQAPPRRHRQGNVSHTTSMPTKRRPQVSSNGRLDTTGEDRYQNWEQSPSPQHRKASIGAEIDGTSGNSNFARSKGFRSVHQINENF